MDQVTNLACTDEKADKVSAFLEELASISKKFGVGIAGNPILFLMEADDYDRIYQSDAESRLEFS